MSGLKTSVDVCVLRDRPEAGWSVTLCVEHEPRQTLGHFDSRAEAMSFALKERGARGIDNGLEVRVVCPEECPCYVEADPAVGAAPSRVRQLPVVGAPAA